MDKYQRPCCILSKVETDSGIQYIGSARGCEIIGIEDFQKVCYDTNVIEKCMGHPNAFGLFIKDTNIEDFIDRTNEILKGIESEPIYRVDYIFDGVNVDGQKILEIADLDYLWGKDMKPALIAVEGLKVTKNMVSLLSADKNPTLKITLPNKTSIIKFGSSDEEYKKFISEGYVEVNIVGECNRNEFNGNVTPQLFMKDYEIISKHRYYF